MVESIMAGRKSWHLLIARAEIKKCRRKRTGFSIETLFQKFVGGINIQLSERWHKRNTQHHHGQRKAEIKLYKAHPVGVGWPGADKNNGTGPVAITESPYMVPGATRGRPVKRCWCAGYRKCRTGQCQVRVTTSMIQSVGLLTNSG